MKLFTLPNFITLANLSFGIVGVWLVFNSRLEYAAYCIIIAAFLDFMDGLVARLLQTYSPIGKDLDSLADLVSFGVLPTFILFHFLDQALPKECYSCARPNLLTLFSILPALFAALRLAKFNIDTRQENGFRGLATPSHAAVVASFVFISTYQEKLAVQFLTPTYLIVYTILISVLMVSDLPMISFKFKNFSWEENKLRYLFILGGLTVLTLFKALGIPIIIFAYVIFSLVAYLLRLRHQVL